MRILHYVFCGECKYYSDDKCSGNIDQQCIYREVVSVSEWYKSYQIPTDSTDRAAERNKKAILEYIHLSDFLSDDLRQPSIQSLFLIATS